MRHHCRRAAVWGLALSALAVPAHAAAATRSLRSGSHGSAVRELQRELGQTGFTLTTNGIYDAPTVQAVKGFQRVANLTLTGVADPITQGRVRQAAGVGVAAVRGSQGAFSYGATTSLRHLGDRIPLHRGMSGHDVRALQANLRRDRVRTAVDGEFGSATLRAVRSWERRARRSVDDVVDAGDLATLLQDVQGGTDPTLPTAPPRLAPGDRAQIGSDGLAVAPASAPVAVQQIIAAGNVIAHKPYRYGGGHGRWKDTGYDCSGSLSYALHGAKLLNTQLTSGDFASWGGAGAGQWVTIYANPGHVYMIVAGIRFDTSGASSHTGTRWQKDLRSGAGYTVRHPVGL